MPIQTRSQTAKGVQASEKLPLTRQEKKQLREEMKQKEREDRQRAWAKKFSEGVHKALRERTQLIIDNNYVNSPIFECLREAKQNFEHFQSLMWFILQTIEGYKHEGSKNLSYIGRISCMSPAKYQNICIWFRKFISLAAEEVTWIENDGDTIVHWNNLNEMFVKHFDIIFHTWNYYKDYFAGFPDCIEF